jgi:hypothetical protein
MITHNGFLTWSEERTTYFAGTRNGKMTDDSATKRVSFDTRLNVDWQHTYIWAVMQKNAIIKEYSTGTYGLDLNVCFFTSLIRGDINLCLEMATGCKG